MQLLRVGHSSILDQNTSSEEGELQQLAVEEPRFHQAKILGKWNLCRILRPKVLGLQLVICTPYKGCKPLAKWLESNSSKNSLQVIKKYLLIISFSSCYAISTHSNITFLTDQIMFCTAKNFYSKIFCSLWNYIYNILQLLLSIFGHLLANMPFCDTSSKLYHLC